VGASDDPAITKLLGPKVEIADSEVPGGGKSLRCCQVVDVSALARGPGVDECAAPCNGERVGVGVDVVAPHPTSERAAIAATARIAAVRNARMAGM
jgi:hypothetical protein